MAGWARQRFRSSMNRAASFRAAYDVDGFAGGEPPFHPGTDKKPPEEKDQHRTDGVNRHEEKHIAGIWAEKRGVALKCDGGRGRRKDAAH